jgi:hypothetical protein
VADDQGAEPNDRDESWDADDGGDEARDVGDCGATDDGADEDEEVSGAFVFAVVSLDNDALLLWPPAATRPAETATATVRVPATTRLARFHFRGPVGF